MKSLTSLIVGVIFGVGLALSGMTDRAKVIGFLDIFGEWVPDLLLVMGVAVCTTYIGFRIVLRRQTPLFEVKFFLPSNRQVDIRLITGASLFGLGWGLVGYCPGPVLSSLAYLQIEPLIFVIMMLIGMTAANRLRRHL
ncbi:MAG: YeeE/YedE family protein [Opitutaceae bacterium]|nr:YeeE/YedE family protein [Opitutaceae bacterium]